MDKRKTEQIYDKYHVNLKYFQNETDTPTYISNYISETEVEGWTNSQPIFISAPTGSGKNTFVNEFLITKFDVDRYYNEDEYFLYLVNRTALKEQVLNNLKESLKTKTIRDYDEFVYVCTYQELNTEIDEKNSKIRKMLEKGRIKYAVMDECHFFLSDSVFNSSTYLLLKYLIINLKSAVRVYMSATLEDVAQVILELEYKCRSIDFSCLYYYFERNYNYIANICAYRKFDEIENFVLETLTKYKEQKFIIFVSRKDEGKKLRNKLTNLNISCVFISSETKFECADKDTYIEYQNIVHNEKFKSQVLISTSVMDNGITIKDKNVVNVVIDVFDRVEMLQMLGRIRVKKDHQINLYIRDYSFGEVEKFYYDAKDELFQRLYIQRLKEEHSPKFAFQANLTKLGNKFTNIFQIIGGEELFDYNQCAIYQLIFQMSFLREILTAMSGKNYSIDEQKLSYEENRIRSNFYGKYSKIKNYFDKRYSADWYESMCRELELKNEQLNGSNLNDVQAYSFFKYLCHLIPYLQSSYFLNKMGYISDKRILSQPEDALKILQETSYIYIDDDNYSYQKNFYKMFELLETTKKMYLSSIEDLKSSPFPALEIQLLWLGRNHLDSSVKYLSSILQLLALSDNEIETLMDDFAITADDYEKYISKDLKHSSNTLYHSFSNQKLLKENGFLKKKTKNLVEEIKDNQFAKIIYWLIHKYKVHEKSIMEILISRMDQQPFVGIKGYYKIRLVRETIESQEYYYILVRE